MFPRTPGERGTEIFFGAWVTLEEESGDRVRYRVVGPDESDPGNGLISMDSPVGQGLLGKSVGDEVTVRRPKGGIDYEIVTVEYESPARHAPVGTPPVTLKATAIPAGLRISSRCQEARPGWSARGG